MKKIAIALLFLVNLSLAQNASTPPKPSTEIVKKISFLNQTGAIGSTTLYSPSVDADFKVSVYISMSTSAPSGSICMDIQWHDDFHTGALGVGSASVSDWCNSGTIRAYTTTIHAIAGHDIVATGADTTDTTHTYSVWVTLEKI